MSILWSIIHRFQFEMIYPQELACNWSFANCDLNELFLLSLLVKNFPFQLFVKKSFFFVQLSSSLAVDKNLTCKYCLLGLLDKEFEKRHNLNFRSFYRFTRLFSKIGL